MFRSCSGLVVSGYSKRRQEKTLENFLTQVIEPYKTFKKMYVVDNATTEFEGLNKILVFPLLIKAHL